MTDPKALQIVKALAARLEVIRTANGYRTDAGAQVYRGRIVFDASDSLPALTVFDDEDDVLQINGALRAKLGLSVTIEGIAQADPDNPSDTGHAMVADIKKAIFSPDYDQTFGGMVAKLSYAGRRMQSREGGSGHISVAVMLTVEYVEDLTNP